MDPNQSCQSHLILSPLPLQPHRITCHFLSMPCPAHSFLLPVLLMQDGLSSSLSTPSLLLFNPQGLVFCDALLPPSPPGCCTAADMSQFRSPGTTRGALLTSLSLLPETVSVSRTRTGPYLFLYFRHLRWCFSVIGISIAV